MPKRYIIPLVVIALLVLSWFFLGSEEDMSAAIYASPKTGQFKVQITTSGELRAKNSTDIRGPNGMSKFRIATLEIQRLVPEGTRVKKGDFVAQLDKSEISDKLKDANQNLEEQQTKLENAKLDSSLSLSQERNKMVDLDYKLREAKISVEQSKYESPAEQRQVKMDLKQAKRAIDEAKKKYKIQKRQSKSDVQRLETKLQEARQRIRNIKQTMKNFTIKAPENGMVIYRRGRGGSKVTEDSDINVWNPVVAKLPDFSVMNSVTYVNEVDIQKVHKGQPVNIGLDAMPEKELTGKVTDVANIGEQRPNSTSKVFQVVIRVNQSDSTLRPSMTTSNEILVNSEDNALFIPLETVHTKDTVDVVFKREKRQPVMQQVVLGKMNGNDVVIKEGVDMDDKLYLSIPSDTSGIKLRRLSPETLEKYRKQQEQEPRQVSPQHERKPRKRPPGRRRDGAPSRQ